MAKMKKLLFGLAVMSLFAVYFVLAFRKPFAPTSLLANLEPSPDSFLYIVPALNFVEGEGLRMAAMGTEIKSSLSPVYGLYLAPFIKVFGDVRAFYLGNMLLGMGSVLFFGLALKNLLGSGVRAMSTVVLLGFLLVSNFYFFNQPILLMAESVNYFLICLFLYWLSVKLGPKSIMAGLVLTVVTGVVKNSNLALAGLFLTVLVIRVVVYLWPDKKKRKYIWVAGAGLLTAAAALIYWKRQLLFNGTSFGFKYFADNWNFYWQGLKGGAARSLWYYHKIQTVDIFILSVAGLAAGMAALKNRLVTVLVWLVIGGFVAAMSIFRDTEGRHVTVLLPLFLFSGGVFLEWLSEKTGRWYWVLLAVLLMVNLGLPYEAEGRLPKIISLKRQVGLNFRHKEDPWNYLCVREFNTFFNNRDTEAYLGSFLPIFYFDIFGNHNYNYLPISDNQEFMHRGIKNYYLSPVKNEYQKLVESGKKVYYSDYYVSNGREAWRKDLENVVTGFRIDKVYQSPSDVCNIYQLSTVEKTL